jgi:general secretion pathway protein E/type IV pilus assembly protein PilB
MAIGPLLIQRGALSQDDLDRALAEQRTSGERLDRVLLRLNLATREQVLSAVGDQFHMPVVDLATITVDAETLSAIPAKLVFRNKCVPILKGPGVLTVATSDPYELAVLDELRLVTGCSIDLVLADDEELHKFIRANYGVGGDTLDALAEGAAAVEVKPAAGGQADSDIEQAQEASVIKLVNDLLTEAISERATDVHVEPYEHELIIRYRIDGVLQKANVPPTINRFGAAIISRLKIMANLNIAEKRRPQDGRITFKCRHQGAGKQAEYDLRVSVIPMLFGEGVVLRVLSKTAVLMSLDDLGMPLGVRKSWDAMINRPHGIVLVTGPTGSGKSTTLYASLNRIVSDAIKVITVEDPVEYHISGINQIQVNHKVGLDFASGLRSILRHDPDVVMIGEIRDKETAETAIQASLTGHLVFSTLHTNDSAGAMTRLLDMGVEPFLVSSSLEGVMAQRLVRKVCPECSLTLDPADPHHADLPPGFEVLPGDNLRHAKGCRNCRNTGYRGRLGVYELLRINDALRQMVMDRINAPQLAAQARKDGNLTTLLEDGYTKARAGVTTLAEVAMAISE